METVRTLDFIGSKETRGRSLGVFTCGIRNQWWDRMGWRKGISMVQVGKVKQEAMYKMYKSVPKSRGGATNTRISYSIYCHHQRWISFFINLRALQQDHKILTRSKQQNTFSRTSTVEVRGQWGMLQATTGWGGGGCIVDVMASLCYTQQEQIWLRVKVATGTEGLVPNQKQLQFSWGSVCVCTGGGWDKRWDKQQPTLIFNSSKPKLSGSVLS